MKKKSALLLATLALSTSVFAQDSKNNNVSGELERPASLKIGEGTGAKNFLSFMFRRIHTLDIQGQVQEMEKDGIKERKYMAVFSASGALVYNHELEDEKIDRYNDTGRNVGVQLLPYTIKYSPDGSYYLALNAASFRNMNSLQGSNNAWRDADLFTVVDNIDFIMVKWDKGMSFDNLSTFSLEYLNADLKLDILNASKKSRFLALTGGAKLVGTKQDLTLDSGEVISIGGGDEKMALLTNFRYGLEYNDQFGQTRLNARVSANHTQTKGYFLDQQKVLDVQAQNEMGQAKYENDQKNYNINIVSYQEGKQNYENSTMNGTKISDESYTALTGIKKPVAPEEFYSSSAEKDKIIRNQIYLSPSIEFSRQVSEPGSRPIRAGLQLNANIPLKDTFQGGKVNMDMKNHNRNLINARLFINF